MVNLHRDQQRNQLTRVDSIAPAPGKGVVVPPELLRDLESTINGIHHLHVLLGEMTEALSSLRQKPLRQETVAFSAQPRKIARLGYRHIRVWPASSCTLTADTSMGLVTLALNAGEWNILDLPDDVSVTLASGGTIVNAIIEHLDF